MTKGFRGFGNRKNLFLFGKIYLVGIQFVGVFLMKWVNIMDNVINLSDLVKKCKRVSEVFEFFCSNFSRYWSDFYEDNSDDEKKEIEESKKLDMVKFINSSVVSSMNMGDFIKNFIYEYNSYVSFEDLKKYIETYTTISYEERDNNIVKCFKEEYIKDAEEEIIKNNKTKAILENWKNKYAKKINFKNELIVNIDQIKDYVIENIDFTIFDIKFRYDNNFCYYKLGNLKFKNCKFGNLCFSGDLGHKNKLNDDKFDVYFDNCFISGVLNFEKNIDDKSKAIAISSENEKFNETNINIKECVIGSINIKNGIYNYFKIEKSIFLNNNKTMDDFLNNKEENNGILVAGNVKCGDFVVDNCENIDCVVLKENNIDEKISINKLKFECNLRRNEYKIEKLELNYSAEEIELKHIICNKIVLSLCDYDRGNDFKIGIEDIKVHNLIFDIEDKNNNAYAIQLKNKNDIERIELKAKKKSGIEYINKKQHKLKKKFELIGDGMSEIKELHLMDLIF